MHPTPRGYRRLRGNAIIRATDLINSVDNTGKYPIGFSRPSVSVGFVAAKYGDFLAVYRKIKRKKKSK